MRRALAIAIAAAGIAAAVWFARSDDGGSREELRRALAAMTTPERFSFDHEPRGTRVLDCFVPLRRFSGTVDLNGPAVAIVGGDGRPLARRIGARLYLAETLLGDDAPPWSSIDVDGSTRSTLVRALGPELAGYVAADGLPPSGDQTALALVGVATGVDDIGRDRYRLDLDAGVLEGLGAVVVEVSLARGHVTAVAVAPEGSELGWRVAYRVPGDQDEIAAPADASALDPAALFAGLARSSECELPL